MTDQMPEPHAMPNSSSTVTDAPVMGATGPNLTHLQEVEHLSHDLKRLVTGCDAAKLDQEIRDEVARLDAWTDTYLAGLDAARHINESAGMTLTEARKELDLAYQQFLTLEDEGGNVATPGQQRETEALSKALRRVNNLIPVMDQVIADPTALPEPEPEPEPSVPQPEIPGPPDLPELDPARPPVPPVHQPDM